MQLVPLFIWRLFLYSLANVRLMFLFSITIFMTICNTNKSCILSYYCCLLHNKSALIWITWQRDLLLWIYKENKLFSSSKHKRLNVVVRGNLGLECIFMYFTTFLFIGRSAILINTESVLVWWQTGGGDSQITSLIRFPHTRAKRISMLLENAVCVCVNDLVEVHLWKSFVIVP